MNRKQRKAWKMNRRRVARQRALWWHDRIKADPENDLCYESYRRALIELAIVKWVEYGVVRTGGA